MMTDTRRCPILFFAPSIIEIEVTLRVGDKFLKYRIVASNNTSTSRRREMERLYNRSSGEKMSTVELVLSGVSKEPIRYTARSTGAAWKSD